VSLVALTWTVCPRSTRTPAPLGVTFPLAILTFTVTSAAAVCEADGGAGGELLLFTGIGETEDGAVDPAGSAVSPAAQPVARMASSITGAALWASQLITQRVGMVRTSSRLVTSLFPEGPTRWSRCRLIPFCCPAVLRSPRTWVAVRPTGWKPLYRREGSAVPPPCLGQHFTYSVITCVSRLVEWADRQSSLSRQLLRPGSLPRSLSPRVLRIRRVGTGGLSGGWPAVPRGMR
jgi:hypothetical protein